MHLHSISLGTLTLALLVFAFVALCIYIILRYRDEPLIDPHFDKNVDLRHYAPVEPHRGRALGVVFVVLALVGVTSWAAQRDEVARAEERAAAAIPRAVPPRPALTIKITRNGIVEAETANCWGVANVRKGTTYNTCAD